MGVFLARAVPSCFALHAMGGIAALDPKQGVQREFRHECVSSPMDSTPAIYRGWRYRHKDWNLRRQLLIGIARQPHLRRTELRAQESLLQVNGLYCFGEKKIDGHSSIGLSQYL